MAAQVGRHVADPQSSAGGAVQLEFAALARGRAWTASQLRYSAKIASADKSSR